MTISKELLDELLKGVERPEDLLGESGLMKELKIKLAHGADAGVGSGWGRNRTLGCLAMISAIYIHR